MSNMDRVANFYSQPSARSGSPIYEKRRIKQKVGGYYDQNPSPRAHAITEGAYNVLAYLIAADRASRKK